MAVVARVLHQVREDPVHPSLVGEHGRSRESGIDLDDEVAAVVEPDRVQHQLTQVHGFELEPVDTGLDPRQLEELRNEAFEPLHLGPEQLERLADPSGQISGARLEHLSRR